MAKKVHILYFIKRNVENHSELISVFSTKKKADYYCSQLNKHNNIDLSYYKVKSEYLNNISFNRYGVLPFELYNPKK